MAEKREEPEAPVVDDGLHPVEPAEGAREPGEEADEGQPPRPEAPAEGER